MNKRKVREVIKYLVQWKEFTAEHNSWEKEENLENTKESVAKFEKRINAEVRRQEKLDLAEERDFRREELPGKYMAKILFGWNDEKFEDKYLKKLEKIGSNKKRRIEQYKKMNQQVSLGVRILKGR